MDELIIPLPSTYTLRCGKSGDYIRICDSAGDEVVYWDSYEWEEEPLLMAAIFNAALTLGDKFKGWVRDKEKR